MNALLCKTLGQWHAVAGLNTCSDAHIEVLATNCYEHMQNLHYCR